MPDMQQLAGATGNIPPQALAALQQQQAGGTDITGILAQLAEMSPDEVSQALQQLGINVDPNTLHDAAAQWVENAGDKQAGGSSDGETTSEEPTSDEATPAAPTPADAPTDDEAAETTPDDEAAEGESGEGEADVAEAGQGASSTNRPPRINSSGRGGAPNPALLARRGGGGMNMDALISAALSQGDPQSMPPPTRPSMRGPTMPPTAAPPLAAGQDPRASAMIASIYRDAAARRGAPSTRAAPPPPMQAGRRRNV